MGCKQSRDSPKTAYEANELSQEAGAVGTGLLEVPVDDYLTYIYGLRNGDFAVAGGEGWLYIYSSEGKQTVKLRAHRKAVNRVLEAADGSLFSASSDGTVLRWKGLKEGREIQEPVQKFEGHILAVSAMDLLEAGLFTGSRDCCVMLWDLETAQSIQKNKILRNVVTAARRCSAHTVVQASEDLQLRLWDSRSSLGKGPVMAVRAGPNQLICLDVPQADAESGASWVACGSKGFSRENCEVKVFDLRGSLRQQAALACADQTIEALQCLGRDQCLIASKDVHLRAIALPEPKVLWERRGSHAGYTALGLASSRCLVASVTADRVALELLAMGE